MQLSPDDLRAARASLKMTQEELAKAIGVCRATINRAENSDTVRPVIALAVHHLVREASAQ